MSDALEEHDGKISIGGRTITNLWFANDIGALAEGEQELNALVESLWCTKRVKCTDTSPPVFKKISRVDPKINTGRPLYLRVDPYFTRLLTFENTGRPVFQKYRSTRN